MTRAYGIERPTRSVCGVCGEPTNRPTRMCGDCADSYEKHAQEDGSIAEVIAWAARRARWYEQRRKRAPQDGIQVTLTDWELHHLQDFAHSVDDFDHEASWNRLDKKLTTALRRARSR